jgi:hypothetical protein
MELLLLLTLAAAAEGVVAMLLQRRFCLECYKQTCRHAKVKGMRCN